MSLQPINVGQTANDGSGDSVRAAFIKANENFTYLQASIVDLVANSLVSTNNVRFDGGGLFTGTFKIRATDLDNYYDIATTNSLFTGGPVSGITTFTNAQDSSNPTGGAVVVTGGVGVAKNLYVGGHLSVADYLALPALSAADINAITGQPGWIVAEVATGKLAYWDVSNNRWSFVIDGSAVA